MGFAPAIAGAFATVSKVVAAATPIFGAVKAVKGLIGGGKGKGGGGAPQPPSMPAPPSPEEARTKAEENRRRRAAQTTGPTIYTNPLGVKGEANIARKTLLGI